MHLSDNLIYFAQIGCELLALQGLPATGRSMNCSYREVSRCILKRTRMWRKPRHPSSRRDERSALGGSRRWPALRRVLDNKTTVEIGDDSGLRSRRLSHVALPDNGFA